MMSTKILSSPTLTDVRICNRLVTPTMGIPVGEGIHVVIPEDWQSRILCGDAVPGCTYASVQSGVLQITDTAQSAISAATDVPGESPQDLASLKSRAAIPGAPVISMATDSEFHVADFGAVGDAKKILTDTSGTDDSAAFAAAINAAKASGSRRILVDPAKAYKLSGLNFDATQGMMLSCDGGLRYNDGAWLRFFGTARSALISARSTLGFRLAGIRFDAGNVTWDQPDFTYPDVATMLADTGHSASDVGKVALVVGGQDFTYASETDRLASSHVPGDLGKYAIQKDTGTSWLIVRVDGTQADWIHVSMRFKLMTTAPTWRPASLDILDLGAINWIGLEGTIGADSANAHIEFCTFNGASGAAGTHVIGAGIRMHNGFNHKAYKCAFLNSDMGISGNDPFWGGNFSFANQVEACTFTLTDDAAIYGPGSGWEIWGCTHEYTNSGAVPKIWAPVGILRGLHIHDNFCSDGTKGIFIDIADRQGLKIESNNMLGDTCVRLINCQGVHSSGNVMFSKVGYQFGASGSAPASRAISLGPDAFVGTTYVSGTNYDSASTVIHPP